MKKYKKIIIQSFVLVLLTLLIFCPLFYVVSASGGFRTQSDVTKLWYDYNESMDSSAKDTYPYSEKDNNGNSISGSGAIKQVAFDIIYGIKRKLVSYTGEIPYKEGVTYDKDGDPNDGFDGLPYNEDRIGVTSKDYWGNISISGTISDFESINKSSVVSLRLYALSTAMGHGLFSGIGNFFYRYVILNLAWLASLLVKLVIQIKNINMTTILQALQIEELADVIFDLFIAKRSSSGKIVALSPLMVISIVCFIFTLVAFVLNYLKGQKKERNLWSDILLLLFVGTILIGVGTGDHVLSLGNTASDLVNGIIASTVAVSDDDTNIWWTKTEDSSTYKANNTQTTIANEISMVNKILIDMEICNQFGVSSIEDLKYTELDKTSDRKDRYNNTLKEYYVDGKAVSIGAPKTVAELTGSNLGYYFWYASSPAKQLRLGNTIPTVGYEQQQKLSQIITYLQKVYNANTDPTIREQILNIIQHFSNPSVGAGMLNMLILIVIYVMLAFVLAMYALKVVMNKLQMFVGILAIPVGGALIASTKPQLVKAGKGILGILIMALIRLTVYGLFFDVILYAVNAVLTTELIRLLIVVVMLFVFLKLRKAIDIAIERALSKLEGQIAPQAREFKAMARNYARRKIGDAKRRINDPEHGKIVGYDENGKPIRKSSRGGLFDTMLNVADNAMSQDAVSHKGLNKIRREAKKDREKAENDAMSKINRSASTVQDQQYEEASQEVNATLEKIAKEEKEQFDELYNAEEQKLKDSEEIEAQLTEEELETLEIIELQKQELEEFVASKKYVDLRRKQPSELTEAELLLLNTYIQREQQLEKECKQAELELQDAIKARLHSEAVERHEEELEKSLTKARDLQEQIIETSGVNNLDKNDPNAKTLKADDFEKMMLREIQLEQLENGEELSTKLTEEEKLLATQAYDKYLKEYRLEQYGTDKSLLYVKQLIGKNRGQVVNIIELKSKQNKIRREETLERTEANRDILNQRQQELIDAMNEQKEKEKQAKKEEKAERKQAKKDKKDKIRYEKSKPTQPDTSKDSENDISKSKLNGEPLSEDTSRPVEKLEEEYVEKEAAEKKLAETTILESDVDSNGTRQTGRKTMVQQDSKKPGVVENSDDSEYKTPSAETQRIINSSHDKKQKGSSNSSTSSKTGGTIKLHSGPVSAQSEENSVDDISSTIIDAPPINVDDQRIISPAGSRSNTGKNSQSSKSGKQPGVVNNGSAKSVDKPDINSTFVEEPPVNVDEQPIIYNTGSRGNTGSTSRQSESRKNQRTSGPTSQQATTKKQSGVTNNGTAKSTEKPDVSSPIVDAPPVEVSEEPIIYSTGSRGNTGSTFKQAEVPRTTSTSKTPEQPVKKQSKQVEVNTGNNGNASRKSGTASTPSKTESTRTSGRVDQSEGEKKSWSERRKEKKATDAAKKEAERKARDDRKAGVIGESELKTGSAIELDGKRVDNEDILSTSHSSTSSGFGDESMSETRKTIEDDQPGWLFK